MEEFKYLSKIKISKLPKSIGVYCFKNEKGILYIGKSVNIKERVRNHFKQPGYKNHLFVDKVKKVGYIETNSEVEALILEANLIKKYQPKYNIIWRDNKNHFFVGITKEEFPRIFLTHQIKIKKQKPNPAWQSKNKNKIKPQQSSKIKSIFIGPFVDGSALKQTLKILRKIFPYRSCKEIPNRPCLWYHLNLCPGPCLLKIHKNSSHHNDEISVKTREKIKKICQKNTKNLIKILKRGGNPVLKELKKEMKKASKNQEFEMAAKIRDQIKSLEKILTHGKIFKNLTLSQNSPVQYKKSEQYLKNLLKTKNKITRIEAYDVSNIQGQKAVASMVVFINELPDKSFYRKFKIKTEGKPNDIAMIKEALSRRLKHLEWGWPDLILVDGGKAQLNAALSVINQYKPIQSPLINVVSLAKRKNELYVENLEKPILLKKLPREVFNLILQLRDEAHRFAISYHRKLRAIDLKKQL